MAKTVLPSSRVQKLKMPEADVTPIMGVIMCIIPMLIKLSLSPSVALISYLPPEEAAQEESSGPGTGLGSGMEAEQKLALTANFLPQGIEISLFGESSGRNFYTISKLADNTYNWEAFVDSLYSIKVNIVGNPIGMDTTRDDKQQLVKTPKYKYSDGREMSLTASNELQFLNIVKVWDICRFKKIVENGVPKEFELFPVAALKTYLRG